MKKLTVEEARRHLFECMNEVCSLCRYNDVLSGEPVERCETCEARARIETLIAAFTDTEQAEDPRFDEFWEAYPNKSNKKDARRLWAKIAPDEELMRFIMAAIEKQNKSSRWKKGFIMAPDRWLKGEHWNDELTETRTDRPYAGFMQRGLDSVDYDDIALNLD